jgi:3-isopropylmalate dehydratase small subunit
VIAPSFARIFENNMFANGLLCIKLDKVIVHNILAANPEEIQIDWEKGIVSWKDNISPTSADFILTEHQKELVRKGGLVVVMLKMAAELQVEGKLE